MPLISQDWQSVSDIRALRGFLHYAATFSLALLSLQKMQRCILISKVISEAVREWHQRVVYLVKDLQTRS